MTGSYEANKKRGFTDCSTEMFYVDYNYGTWTTQESSICSEN